MMLGRRRRLGGRFFFENNDDPRTFWVRGSSMFLGTFFSLEVLEVFFAKRN